MIVIPMAGLSSRFLKAGFEKPKYMLEAHGKTLFEHSVESFKEYFKHKRFLFIVRDIFDTPNFVKDSAESLGIINYEIIVINKETRGQAETVFLGLNKTSYEGPITIFNIDTFRPGFKFPDEKEPVNGYLEVFTGEGKNWSFVKPDAKDSTRVEQTTEKNPISELCCTGLYHFYSTTDYLDAYNDYLEKPESKWEMGELYVAPLYNYLIQQGKYISYNIINREDVIFCGIPEEYNDFLERDVNV